MTCHYLLLLCRVFCCDGFYGLNQLPYDALFQLPLFNSILQVSDCDHLKELKNSAIVQLGRDWFTHELVLGWWTAWFNPGTNYKSFWNNQVSHYIRVTYPPFTTTVAKRLMVSGYKPFMSACIHYVLLQRIDYGRFIGGKCMGGCRSIVMDGVNVSFSVKKCNFQYPWSEQADDGRRHPFHEHDVCFIPQVQPGVTAKDRVEILRLLRTFCLPSSKFNILKHNVVVHDGLSENKWNDLREVLQEYGSGQGVEEYSLIDPLLEMFHETNNGFRSATAVLAAFLNILVSPYPLTASLPDFNACRLLEELVAAYTKPESGIDGVPAIFDHAVCFQSFMDACPVIAIFIGNVTNNVMCFVLN